MIIGISGKIGSGKDTVGGMIQFLTMPNNNGKTIAEYFGNVFKAEREGWQIKKFAGKLKECISIITGIPVHDLEKQEVKDSSLGPDWIRYSYATGFTKDNKGNVSMLSEQCDKEMYLIQYRTNWQTAYKTELTVRMLLQWLGTEVGRVIHRNFWVNALFADYRKNYKLTDDTMDSPVAKYKAPNWIITDMRFPNELEAIKQHGGITIRINRRSIENVIHDDNEHPSETALDNAEFDYVIDNNGTIQELASKVSDILVNAGIIKLPNV